MSFGDSDPPSPQYIPPPPEKEELMDVIDHVSGTEAVTIVGADGKKRRVIQRLPRSPEEQKLYDDAGALMDRSLQEIVRLNEYDPTQVVDFAPFAQVLNDLDDQRKEDIATLSNIPDFNAYIGDLKERNRSIIEKEFARQMGENQEYLNRRGYSDSTAEREMRNSLAQNRANALLESDLVSQQSGEQLRAADLANRQNTFNLREQGRAGQLQKAQHLYQLENEKQKRLEEQRQLALQNQFGLFQTGAHIRGEDTSKAMATKAPELANQIFQQSNADSLNRYSAQVGAINANYQNQLAHYNSRGPTFGDSLLGLGTNAFGAYAGSYAGSLGKVHSGLPESLQKNGIKNYFG